MLRAHWGTAPKGEGCATRRATDRLANIGVYALYSNTSLLASVVLPAGILNSEGISRRLP
jgi:hypothetical protein